VRASMRGWEYAKANPDEAAQIVLDNDMSGALTLESQVYQVNEAAALVGDSAALDPAAYEQTVQTLLSAVSPDNPAITKEPEGAFSTVVTDKLD
jgi:NitT/TauT family transport system substrate-binding protein